MKASARRGPQDQPTSHRQAALKFVASPSFRTKTTDEEGLSLNMGGRKMPNPEEDRHARSNR
jgi:hypothetical protein